MSKFTTYKSIYGSSLKEEKMNRLTPKKQSIKEKTLKYIKRALREAADEVGASSGAVDSAIDQIEDIVVDVIDNHGLSNPVVDTLSNAVKDLEAQKDIQDNIDNEDIDGMMEAEQNPREALNKVIKNGEIVPPQDHRDPASLGDKTTSRVQANNQELGLTENYSNEEDEDDKDDLKEWNMDDEDEDEKMNEADDKEEEEEGEEEKKKEREGKKEVKEKRYKSYFRK